MAIEGINSAGYSSYSQTTVSATKAASVTIEVEQEAAAEVVAKDEFVKSEDVKDVGYENLKAKASKMVGSMTEQRHANLQKLVAAIFGEQANAIMNAKGGLKNKMSGIIAGMENVEEASAAARNAISEEGEFGVNAVATRIMDMAVSLSGGDSSKLNMLKDAVIKGFSQATSAWGDKLPDICSKTYDEIMNRFDYWEQNGSLDGYAMNSAAKDEE